MTDSDDPRELLQRGYRYALALCHDPVEADELLQEGWISLLRADGPRRFGYLARCIRSRFIDRHRRSRLEPVPMEPDHFDRIAQTDGGEPIALVPGRLEEALGHLRPEQRELLVLHIVEGWTAGELARQRGRPRGTILSALFRARRKLHSLLGLDREETA